MIRVSIIGGTGYTGAELIRILARHPKVKLSHLISESNDGAEVKDILPNLNKIINKTFIKADYEKIAKDSDVVFLCLPHSVSMEIASILFNLGVLVVDLSADFRFHSQTIYEKTYNTTHKAPELLEKSVYCIPELNYEAIKSAELLAIPGCYPTSAIIPLAPLLKAKIISDENIIIDSKSGVSGAGKIPKEGNIFCYANENFSPYSIFTHRHKPEIDNSLKLFSQKETNVVFTPHLLPLDRGILSTIYCKSNFGTDVILRELKETYNDFFFVRFPKSIPRIKSVAYTNFIDINVFSDNGNIIIVSTIDNILKGASGQAVQSFNIKMGFEETLGLL